MSCNIQVLGIKIPQPIYAACHNTITVVLENTGPDPMQLGSPDQGFWVCLESSDFQTEGDVYYARFSLLPEQSQPPLNRQFFVTFSDVVFRSPGLAQVRATADGCRSGPGGALFFEVINNARTQPSYSVSVSGIGSAAWLWTEDVQTGLEDSTGLVTWDPQMLCSGNTLTVLAMVANKGSGTAQASQAELTLLDGLGNSLGSVVQSTPPIRPGTKVPVVFKTTVPTLIGPGSITIRVCADITTVVTPQCDLGHLCEIAGPFPIMSSGSSAPTLTLSVNAPIFPGQPASVNWQIQNSCSDLGHVTAKISFNGIVIYTSPSLSAGLQSKAGEQNISITPPFTITRDFWKIGTKTLQLEVTATGHDPGPYNGTALLEVVGEPVGAGLWMWTSPAQGAVIAWKDTYIVAGTLSNPTTSHSTMTPASIDLFEQESDPGPSPGAPFILGPVVARAANPPVGSLAPGAIGAVSWSGIVQNWAWFVPVVWKPDGPVGKRFDYTVKFSLQDEYGNAYPLQTSSDLMITVAVSIKKQALLGTAIASEEVALTFVALAALALAGFYTALGAPVLGAIAGGAESAATAAGAAANDPPVPDFNYHEVVYVVPPSLPETLTSLPSRFSAFRSVFELIGRILAAHDVLSQIHGKLIAARIDNDAEGLRMQAASYREALRLLVAAAEQLPSTVAEAVGAIEAENLPTPTVLSNTLDAWQREGLPNEVRQLWAQTGQTEEGLASLEAALRLPSESRESFPTSLEKVSQALLRLAQEVEAESSVILVGLPQ